MKRFFLVVFFLLLAPIVAHAQAAVSPYCGTGLAPPNNTAPCSSTYPFPVQIVGGGGGGLSVTDSASWTTGVSPFTPSGGEYNATPATVSSGQQGTFAMSQYRNLYVDVPTTNNNLYAALTSPLVAGTNIIGYTSNDPCAQAVKLKAAINVATSGVDATPLITGASSKKTYICSIVVNNNAAANIAIYEANTGTSCATNKVPLWGGTTESTGFQFSAQSGLSNGNGLGTIMVTAATNTDVCIDPSASTQVTGALMYVQQ